VVDRRSTFLYYISPHTVDLISFIIVKSGTPFSILDKNANNRRNNTKLPILYSLESTIGGASLQNQGRCFIVKVTLARHEQESERQNRGNDRFTIRSSKAL
jgi:hypothetical protein